MSLELKAITKTFGDLTANDSIDLKVAKGEIHAILGENGAGKSTLINILAGLAKPSSGSIKVMGHDVIQDYQNARRSLGVVPQELVFDPFFNVREMLRFQAGYFGKGRENDDWIDEVIEGLDLQEKANTNMRMLSGGMKRRALIAQALVHKPPVIVLDEPTAGVDVDMRKETWKVIRDLKQQGVTIVLTTHYIEEAEAIADRVGVIDNGEMIVVDETNKLISRMGQKKLTIQLQEKVMQLPESLAKYNLELASDGFSLAYSYDKESKQTGITNLLQQVKDSGMKLSDLKTEQGTLEDIFVSLVHKEKK